MQSIYILGDQREVRDPSRQYGKGVVSRIWFHLANQVTPPFVPFPDQFGVGDKCIHGSEVFWTELRPEPFIAAEGRDSRFGRHSGAGQDNSPLGMANDLRNLLEHGIKIAKLTGRAKGKLSL